MEGQVSVFLTISVCLVTLAGACLWLASDVDDRVNSGADAFWQDGASAGADGGDAANPLRPSPSSPAPGKEAAQ